MRDKNKESINTSTGRERILNFETINVAVYGLWGAFKVKST